jgi:hypothetical protein
MTWGNELNKILLIIGGCISAFVAVPGNVPDPPFRGELATARLHAAVFYTDPCGTTIEIAS